MYIPDEIKMQLKVLRKSLKKITITKPMKR